jgi:hypothetical protein
VTTFANDTFTGTTGTTLASHTPDAGGSWVANTNSGGNAQLTSSGRLRGTSSSVEADYLCQGTPASADYNVQCDLVTGSSASTNYAGVFGRTEASGGSNVSTGATYFFMYDRSVPGWQLWKGVNNNFIQLGSTFASTIPTNTTTTFILKMLGTSIKGTVAGTDQISTTDTGGPSLAAKAGILLSTGTAIDGNSLELDNFSATDAAAASTFPPLPAVWHNPLLPQ